MEQRALRTPSPLLHISVVRVGVALAVGSAARERRAWSGTGEARVEVGQVERSEGAGGEISRTRSRLLSKKAESLV